MADKYININFPFSQSNEGFYLGLTKTDNEAIKADLMHLILTRKGERLYNPEFGTNLLRYIFEPNDGITLGDLKHEIDSTVRRYIPKLAINDIKVENVADNEHIASVRIDYTVTEDTFSSRDFVIINI